MPPRFYAPDLDPSTPEVTLSADESRHLSRVLRLRVGDDIEVFDGRGLMVAAVVTVPDSRAAAVQIRDEVAAQPEVPWPLVICAALLKGDAMDAVVRDATVLGASAIVPIVSGRTSVPGGRLASGGMYARWARVAVAAAKQCRRARLPELVPARTVHDIINEGSWRGWDRRWLVEPSRVDAGAEAPAEDRTSQGSTREAEAPGDGVVLAIGPEGGWTAEEVLAARAAGWQAWSLGPYTLRAEQMVLAALAIVRHARTLPVAPRDADRRP